MALRVRLVCVHNLFNQDKTLFKSSPERGLTMRARQTKRIAAAN